jgi:hypothetical protein
MSRLAASTANVRLVSSKQPFSNFDYVDTHFAQCLTARRLFTLARARGFQSFACEEVRATGAVAAENRELKSNFPSYESSTVVRITFWQKLIRKEADLDQATSNDLVGFVILKKDILSDREPTWHIFESMLRGYSRYDDPDKKHKKRKKRKEKAKEQSRLSYQKLLYSGVESGAGALIGFMMDGIKANKSGSGHTPLQLLRAPTT